MKEHKYKQKRFERERYYEESTYKKEKGSMNKNDTYQLTQEYGIKVKTQEQK